jgi:RNA polymerase sigma-70 factor (ECF subfamily)
VDPLAPVPPPTEGALWVQPCPDDLVDATPASPEAAFSTRESVQLAFVVALQHLPASQRAALILRDVVGWSASEVAELLDTTVVSVNSALQRAREALEAKRPRFGSVVVVAELVQRYARAWESGDVDALVALLHEDVVSSMPPIPIWLAGRDALRAFIAPRIGAPGNQRVVPIACADGVGFAFYRKDGGERHAAHAIQIVRWEEGSVREIHAFLDASLFSRFGLADHFDR